MIKERKKERNVNRCQFIILRYKLIKNKKNEEKMKNNLKQII